MQYLIVVPIVGAVLWSLSNSPGGGAIKFEKAEFASFNPSPSGTSPKNRGGDAAILIFSFPRSAAECGYATPKP